MVPIIVVGILDLRRMGIIVYPAYPRPPSPSSIPHCAFALSGYMCESTRGSKLSSWWELGLSLKCVSVCLVVIVTINIYFSPARGGGGFIISFPGGRRLHRLQRRIGRRIHLSNQVELRR